MTWFAIIGYFATVLSIGMYMPQSFSVVKSKKTGTLSKTTFLVILFGSLMWTLFSGINSQDIPNNIPAYLTNVLIVFLMFPIVWYLFANHKNRNLIFTLIVFFSVIIISLASIIMFDRKMIFGNASQTTITILGYVFVSCAGSCTGLPFFPQMIKIIKEKRIGDINIWSSLLVVFANLLWTFFWTGNMLYASAGSMYISITMSVMAMILQLPIIYVYVKSKKN